MAAGAFLSLLARGAFLLLLIGSPHVFPALPVEPRHRIAMHQIVLAVAQNWTNLRAGLLLFLLKLTSDCRNV